MELLENPPQPVSLPNPFEPPSNLTKEEPVGFKSRLIKIWRSFIGFLKRVARFPFKTRRRKIISFSFLGLLVLLLIFFIGLPFALLYPSAKSLKPKVGDLKDALAARDLAATESALVAVNADFDKLDRNYRRLIYFKTIPFVNRYYADGMHVLTAGRLGLDSIGMVVETIKPYEEVLGLKVGFGSQITVDQQVARLVDTLPKMADGLDEVWVNIGKIREGLSQIDAQRYPEAIKGVKVRFWLEQAQVLLEDTEPMVSQGRAILEVAPSLLGSPQRTYLVLFQNDAELRATGGFITGFSLLKIKSGKVLDNSFYSGAYFAKRYPSEMGAPPRPIAKYLVPRWHFQDANFWPDFPTTAKGVMTVWGKSGLEKISGVVAINTEIASDLLKLVGSIHIPTYDWDLANSTLPEDCKGGGRNFTGDNLFCRLEYYVEKVPRGGNSTEARKEILDLISDALIKKVSKASAEMWPKLIDFVFKHFSEKNLLVYVPNQKEEDLLKSFGYTGEIKEFEGDYLHISDSNFGGLKTNHYMTQEFEQSLQKQENGTWRKTVKIKYYNPQPYDSWLSGNYKDFVRIYVPSGSKLVSVEGALHIWTYKDQWATGIQNPLGWKENGKTVFGAYFTLWPQKEHTLTFVYDLPEGAVGESEYRVLVQKQPGTNIGLVSTQLDGKVEVLELDTDIVVTLPVSN